VAGITAFVAVKWMISYLTRRSLSIFGWYRLAAAAAAAVLVLAGAL
jgi:undecaprenyl-diphosphatase